ncbi:conserved Plasmodium protein, unknown function [Plasmodium falciparum 3D7]|uniref:Uncharacterized protein n=1 Tax=Plasmodium falciparum (isolate 3D7) TaxID=36329 RepID=C0H493_PLAF7|nr:conserved Plasmodium protein, unknown function [Plasmodium falciparum 3D7]CAX63914.1 conserved Plasmodium protein, unknown function [Plasmodium falciparum 3D7]|eukprot:XP_002808644.1 conserved Plasmodium protein, unknown function [Plasmodium falciparum 3D7]
MSDCSPFLFENFRRISEDKHTKVCNKSEKYIDNLIDLYWNDICTETKLEEDTDESKNGNFNKCQLIGTTYHNKNKVNLEKKFKEEDYKLSQFYVEKNYNDKNYINNFDNSECGVNNISFDNDNENPYFNEYDKNKFINEFIEYYKKLKGEYYITPGNFVHLYTNQKGCNLIEEKDIKLKVMSRNKNKKKYKYCMNDVSYYNSINNKDRNNLNNVNKLRKRKTKYDKNEKVMFHKRFSSYNMGSARKEKALSKKAKKREKLWKRNKKKREKKECIESLNVEKMEINLCVTKRSKENIYNIIVENNLKNEKLEKIQMKVHNDTSYLQKLKREKKNDMSTINKIEIRNKKMDRIYNDKKNDKDKVQINVSSLHVLEKQSNILKDSKEFLCSMNEIPVNNREKCEKIKEKFQTLFGSSTNNTDLYKDQISNKEDSILKKNNIEIMNESGVNIIKKHITNRSYSSDNIKCSDDYKMKNTNQVDNQWYVDNYSSQSCNEKRERYSNYYNNDNYSSQSCNEKRERYSNYYNNDNYYNDNYYNIVEYNNVSHDYSYYNKEEGNIIPYDNIITEENSIIDNKENDDLTQNMEQLQSYKEYIKNESNEDDKDTNKFTNLSHNSIKEEIKIKQDINVDNMEILNFLEENKKNTNYPSHVFVEKKKNPSSKNKEVDNRIKNKKDNMQIININDIPSNIPLTMLILQHMEEKTKNNKKEDKKFKVNYKVELIGPLNNCVNLKKAIEKEKRLFSRIEKIYDVCNMYKKDNQNICFRKNKNMTEKNNIVSDDDEKYGYPIVSSRSYIPFPNMDGKNNRIHIKKYMNNKYLLNFRDGKKDDIYNNNGEEEKKNVPLPIKPLNIINVKANEEVNTKNNYRINKCIYKKKNCDNKINLSGIYKDKALNMKGIKSYLKKNNIMVSKEKMSIKKDNLIKYKNKMYFSHLLKNNCIKKTSMLSLCNMKDKSDNVCKRNNIVVKYMVHNKAQMNKKEASASIKKYNIHKNIHKNIGINRSTHVSDYKVDSIQNGLSDIKHDNKRVIIKSVLFMDNTHKEGGMYTKRSIMFNNGNLEKIKIYNKKGREGNSFTCEIKNNDCQNVKYNEMKGAKNDSLNQNEIIEKEKFDLQHENRSERFIEEEKQICIVDDKKNNIMNVDEKRKSDHPSYERVLKMEGSNKNEEGYSNTDKILKNEKNEKNVNEKKGENDEKNENEKKEENDEKNVNEKKDENDEKNENEKKDENDNNNNSYFYNNSDTFELCTNSLIFINNKKNSILIPSENEKGIIGSQKEEEQNISPVKINNKKKDLCKNINESDYSDKQYSVLLNSIEKKIYKKCSSNSKIRGIEKKKINEDYVDLKNINCSRNTLEFFLTKKYLKSSELIINEHDCQNINNVYEKKKKKEQAKKKLNRKINVNIPNDSIIEENMSSEYNFVKKKNNNCMVKFETKRSKSILSSEIFAVKKNKKRATNLMRSEEQFISSIGLVEKGENKKRIEEKDEEYIKEKIKNKKNEFKNNLTEQLLFFKSAENINTSGSFNTEKIRHVKRTKRKVNLSNNFILNNFSNILKKLQRMEEDKIKMDEQKKEINKNNEKGEFNEKGEDIKEKGYNLLATTTKETAEIKEDYFIIQLNIITVFLSDSYMKRVNMKDTYYMKLFIYSSNEIEKIQNNYIVEKFPCYFISHANGIALSCDAFKKMKVMCENSSTGVFKLVISCCREKAILRKEIIRMYSRIFQAPLNLKTYPLSRNKKYAHEESSFNDGLYEMSGTIILGTL